MNKRTVTYESVRAGQPRAYADHEYEGYLTFEYDNPSMRYLRMETQREQVKPYVRLFVGAFDYDRQAGEPCPPDGWHRPWLEKLEMVEPGRWHVIVKSPYLD